MIDGVVLTQRDAYSWAWSAGPIFPSPSFSLSCSLPRWNLSQIIPPLIGILVGSLGRGRFQLYSTSVPDPPGSGCARYHDTLICPHLGQLCIHSLILKKLFNLHINSANDMILIFFCPFPLVQQLILLRLSVLLNLLSMQLHQLRNDDTFNLNSIPASF